MPATSPMELRTILDWVVTYQLRSVPGVVEVNSFGGELKTYQVTLDPQAPGRATGSRSTTCFEAARAQQRQRRRRLHRSTRASSTSSAARASSTDLDDIGDVVVAHDEDGTPIYVRNVADRRVRADDPPRRGDARRPRRGRHRHRHDADGRELARGRRPASRRRSSRSSRPCPRASRSTPSTTAPSWCDARSSTVAAEPGRRRPPGHRRPVAAAGQPARRPDRGLGDPALDAGRLHRRCGSAGSRAT